MVHKYAACRMRLRLTIAYDGEPFRGWQVQPGVKTVQGAIEECLGRLAGDQPVRIHASGRTDTGVHAVGQVVHLDFPGNPDIVKLEKSLRAMLPEAIAVHRIREVDPGFHARFSAIGREYRYRLIAERDLFQRYTSWLVDEKLELCDLEEVSSRFIGEYDFRAFSSRPEDKEKTRCHVREINWYKSGSEFLFQVKADRFLRRMVRTLVGTIVAAALDRFDINRIGKLLEGNYDPHAAKIRAAVPAPPQGLALYHVRYKEDDKFDIPVDSPWEIRR